MRVFAATFDAVVRIGQRRFAVVAELLVEIFVLFLRDLALAARPERRSLVDALPFVGHHLGRFLGVPGLLAHQDRQRDMVRVFADDRLQPPGLEELLLAFTQMQSHFGTTRGLGDRLDLVFAGAFGTPAHALVSAQARTPGFDRDAVSNDEARIKTDAELADQVGVLFLVATELFHELACTALGDRAEMGNRLVGAHADAVVGDRDRARFFVKADPNLKVGLILEIVRVIKRLEAQLVAGIRGIRHQFAQENFLVRIQRMGDEMQNLLDLGLEGMGLLFFHDQVCISNGLN